jgi:hypothetical protein
VEVPSERFPFGLDFQKMLLRLLCEDAVFAHQVAQYLKPTYFENEALAWAWGFALRYREQYHTFPSILVILEESRRLDPRYRMIYSAVLEQAATVPLRDDIWIRDNVLDFIRRNIFTRAFHESRDAYNSGKVSEAYDTMMGRMHELMRAQWEPIARTWLCAELPSRQTRRLRDAEAGMTITTGFPTLDKMMKGGAHYGELLLWISYPKIGKSVVLMNHGVAAVRDAYKNVLHCVFEGSPSLVEDRYDAAFSGEVYHTVRMGGIDARRYAQLYEEYQQYRSKLVVRTFIERWDYSITDIQDEVVALKRDYGWRPDMIIIDYGDLLEGRGKQYRNTYESQKAVFRDLKSMANRGYVLWSASQAVRPKEKDENDPKVLMARDIADCYEKVRIADFVGSINQTLVERFDERMRLYADIYRDARASELINVYDHRDAMTLREGYPPPKSPYVPQQATVVPPQGAVNGGAPG